MALHVGSIYADLQVKDAGYRAGLTKARGEAGKAGKAAGRSFSSKMGDSIKSMAQGAGMLGVGYTLGRTLMGGFKAGIDSQNAQRTLAGLYDSGEDAKRMMKSISEVSRNSPIETTAYQKAAEALAYTGVKGEEAKNVLEHVGNAIVVAGGDASNLRRVNEGLTRMTNQGKVTRETLNQISDAGVPVFDALSSEIGVTKEKLTDMITAGKVEIPQVMKALSEGTGKWFHRMDDASERVAQSFGNQWKMAKDNLEQAIGQGILPVMKALTPVLSGLGKAAEVMGDAISDVSSVFDSLPGPVKTATKAIVGLKVASLALGSSFGRRMVAPMAAAARSMGSMATGARVAGTRMGVFGTQVARVGRAVPVVGRMHGAFMRGAQGAQRFGRMAGVASAATTGLRSAANGVLGILGGPWGLAFTVATVGITHWMQKNREAEQVVDSNQQAINDLAGTIAESGSEWTKAGQDAARSALDVIKLSDGSTTLAQSLEDLGVPLDQAAAGIAGMGSASEKTMRQLEEQIGITDDLKEKAEEVGIDPVDIKIRDAGGDVPDDVETYKKLRETNEKISEERRKAEAEKAAVQDALKFSFDVDIDDTGIDAITEALGDMADESKSATDRIKSLTNALDQVWGDKFTSESAQANFGEALRDITDALGGLDQAAINADGSLDTMSESGAALFESLGDYSSAMNQTAATMLLQGKSVDEVNAKLQSQRDEFIEAANAAGITGKAAEDLADHYGLIPDDIRTQVFLDGVEPAQTAAGILHGKIDSITDNKIITTSVMSDEAVEKLRGLGLEVQKTPDGKHLEITANDRGSTAVLQLINQLMRDDNTKNMFVNIDGEEYSIESLNTLRDQVNSDNAKNIVVDSNSQQVIDLLEALNVSTTTLPDGSVHIDDNAATVQEKINNLTNPTSSQHTVHVNSVFDSATQWLRSQNISGMPGMSVNENGSIRERASGALDTAQIQSGSGQGIVQHTGQGPVRWAEGETGWEAFIPGAPSKRRRSTTILTETAKRMGYALIPRTDIRGMANGGLSDSQQANAQAIIAQGRTMGMSDQAIQSALATALVESDMTMFANSGVPESMNLPHQAVGSDHDSVGLFQQRGNGAWGPLSQRMDPKGSARAYFEAYRERGGDTMPPGVAAQSVQSSAFPDRYATRMDQAGKILATTPSGFKITGAESSGDRPGELGSDVTGDPVYVTNWPSGLRSYSRTTPSPLSDTDDLATGEGGLSSLPRQEDEDEGPQFRPAIIGGKEMPFPAVDPERVPDVPDMGRIFAEAYGDDLWSSMGGGNGFLPTLLRKGPEMQKALDDERRERGPTVENNWNVTVANVEELIRKVQQRNGVQLDQILGGAL